MIFRTLRNGATSYTALLSVHIAYILLTLEPVQYVIYALAVPFDLKCESGT